MKRPLIRAVGTLVGAVAATLTLTAQTVNTIINNGPTTNRYDLVILGDGYQAFEESTFDADALRAVNHMFTVEPYASFGQFFNVHTVFRPSTMSGANHPDQGIYNNPVYGASYNTGGTPRCLYITNRSLALADASLAPSAEGRVMVIVNDSRYGGCGGTFAVSYSGSSMPDVQVHELGHSLGGLADEYDGINSTYTGPEPNEKNATKHSGGQKWSAWLGTNGIGAFEGARYYDRGIYRPWNDCLMRSLGRPLCSVCREQLTLFTNNIVSAIDAPQPPGTTVALTISSPPQGFSFTNLAPASSNALVTWSLNGQVVATGTTSFTVDPTAHPLGSHTLMARVQDRNAMVRTDPAGLMDHRRTWTVQISDPLAADVLVDSVAGSAIFTAPGSAIDLTTTVRNGAGVAAGSFEVEHFLSEDGTIDGTDIYLGSYTVPGLAPGQTHVHVRNGVQLPSRLTATSYFLGAFADRAQAIPDLNRTNNTRITAIVPTAAPCPPVLEYRDPLLYPADNATIDLATGGIVLPTVVAPCAQPGTAYFLVWGCSGTVPGTPLGSLVVPINQDHCTAYSLSGMNGSVFVQSFGTLDGNGIGYPEFHWPAGLGPLPLTGHFAAILIDSTFAGVTNPVGISIQ